MEFGWVGQESLVLGDMAGAGGWELVGIDEESTVQVTGVERDHPVVHVLLGTLGLVAWGEKSASRIRSPASFQSSSLGVVVLTVSVLLGNMLKNDSPKSLDVNGATDLGVVDIRRAEVSLGSDPVRSIIRRGALGGSGVVAVVECVLLILGDVLHKVVGALIGNVGVLLQEDGVVADLGGDFILGVFRVDKAKGKVCVDSTGWRCLGVAVGWWRWWGIGWGRRMGSEDNGDG